MNDPVNENGKPSANSSSSPDPVRLDQKVGAKPSSRERSQGWAVMSSREVASLPSRMGSPLGQFQGRASVLRAKSASPLCTGIQDAVCSVIGVLLERVIPAITCDKRNIHSTDEILRRPGLSQVNSGYKPMRKASVTRRRRERFLPGPVLKDLSSAKVGTHPAHWVGPERQNLSVPAGTNLNMGKVSAALEATKWPDRTSSSQPAPQLRNMPQQRNWIRQAVRQH